ncbi:rhodanese-like domain-containing protein [Limosilactobacillus caecicola]|uniref:rhodanese-like domain-containing protein n=1 Tax=Limosilactobacillus caecicola TaxID=2941332 RepID=UPI00203DE6FF|nr:rhodanese-like domain-containing protein [Limosilactobacillus caecicola]
MVIAAISSGALILDIIVIVLLLVWLGSYLWGRWRRNHYATVIDEEAFQKGIHKAQVIDLRPKNQFDRGHILGARSMPLAFLLQQYDDLRPDLPVYLYDEGMTLSTQAAAFLGKHGFDNLYILQGGYSKWTGKTKKAKYSD